MYKRMGTDLNGVNIPANKALKSMDLRFNKALPLVYALRPITLPCELQFLIYKYTNDKIYVTRLF